MKITLTEALTKLLHEESEQAKHPEVWQDGAWKNHYYGLYNYVYDNLALMENTLD